MGNRIWSLLSVLLVVVSCTLVAAVGGHEESEWRWTEEETGGGTGRRKGEKWFLLQDSKHVVKTDAGDMKLVKGFAGKFMRSPIHIGFIKMEPKSLFIPQYLDSSLILFIHRELEDGRYIQNRGRIGFYLINTAEDQRLHVICSIDTSESLGWHTIQSFFIAGGTYPTSVLSGFDHSTLSAAFNHHKLAHMRRIVHIRQQDIIDEEEDEQPTWSLRKFLFSVFGNAYERREDIRRESSKGPETYNIYDRKPDFKNDYGSTIALDASNYSPLMHDDVGVYLVNLTAGSMMAPHMNPRATEYGIVLRGSGTIQIVYPNGSLAMKAKVKAGDVFWIPRYFPFCQTASENGPFEFFGFTTSARDNKPQFLVGANSLLHALRGPEFEAAFEMSKERLNEIIDAQRESVILPPSAAVARPVEVVDEGYKVAEMIRSFGNEVVMQFD
ncbi:hypothetical protein DH2020_000148 [Rehmannia glutinosa]|uniref:Cupin type-1 domain-containing protein n=1 Tax=Rehmannia glutinosa TaxID=99300 RepID=A0ABR0XVY8_REHGL